jgi:ferrous iron transport protein A
VLDRRHRHRRRRGCGAEAPAPEATTLDALPVGERCLVAGIRGERRLRRRLMEMGVLPGSRLRVVKLGPTGDPIQVKVNDYFLSIRRSEAAKIIVRPADDGAELQNNGIADDTA